MRCSPGMVLLIVGRVPPRGVASMRKPVMVSTLERQVSVIELSFISEIRTRLGGLTSAWRRGTKKKKIEMGMNIVCLLCVCVRVCGCGV